MEAFSPPAWIMMSKTIELGFGIRLTGKHEQWPDQVCAALVRWYGVNMVPPAIFVSPGMWEPMRHAVARAATLGGNAPVPVYVDAIIPVTKTSTVYIRAYRKNMDADTRYTRVNIHERNA